MKSIKLIVLLSVAAALLISCGSGDGTPNPEHTGEYLDAVSALTQVAHSLDEDDLALIAHLVSCETGELPFETQVCFAAMVLNRISDPGFPAEARGVVLDSGDFRSVLSGRVTGSIPQNCTAKKNYLTALKAVRLALSGSDPTGGALYFAEENSATSYAVQSYKSGGMVFGR